MRDNLDLQELRERVDYYKTQGRKRRNRALIWTIGILIISGWLWLQFDTHAGYIYTYVDGDWVQHEYDAPPKQFTQSADGQSLWLQTFSPYHLIEIGEESWTEYRASDVSECCFKFDGELGTFDDFSYFTHGNSNAFYKNGKWSYREDWASTDIVIDVVLSTYTYGIVDANHDIYLIESDGEWMLVNPSKSSTSQPDVLAIDDTLFLVQDGIWQYIYEETAWKLYHPLAENVQYLGNDTNNMWLSDSQHLIRYTIANNEIKGYYLKDLNLSPDVELVEVVTDRSKTYLVTRNEVIRIDDESWDLADVPDTVHGITSIGVLSNGAWLIASSDLDLVAQGWSSVLTYNFFRDVIPLVAAIVLILALLGWLIPYANQQKIRTERSKKLISAVFPDMPIYEPLLNNIGDGNNISIRSILRFAGLFSLFVIAITFSVVLLSFFNIIQADSKGQADLSMAIVTILSILWLGFYIYRHYRKKDEESRQYIKRNIKVFAGAIVILASAFGAVFVVIEVLLAPVVTEASLRVGIFIVALFVIVLLYFALFWKKPQVLFPDGLMEGDYPKALATLEKRSKNIVWRNSSKAYQGATLYLIGDYEQAYTVYLELIRESQNSLTILLAMYLTDTGGLLYRMGQLDRAMTVYQAAVAILPENPFGYAGLVDSYNNQREYPERALELSHEMLTKIPDKPNRFIIPIISEMRFYGIHAIALANMGQFDEAESYIQKMYDYADESFIPYYAASLRADALVKLAQGKIEEAKTLLNRALELDPKGDNANQIQKDFDYIDSLFS